MRIDGVVTATSVDVPVALVFVLAIVVLVTVGDVPVSVAFD